MDIILCIYHLCVVHLSAFSRMAMKCQLVAMLETMVTYVDMFSLEALGKERWIPPRSEGSYVKKE